MHDIWNPWHGCVRWSEGCDHCYMMYMDEKRGQDASRIYRTAHMDYPLGKDRQGAWRIKSGEMLRVCMTSDFFLEEADKWRMEAWAVIRQRPDVMFYLLTKRPHRVEACLPRDWGDGWENVFFNITCENQRRADERLPYLLALPFRHKGVMAAPLIGPVVLGEALASGQIEQVACGGENYGGERICRYAWAKSLYDECVAADVTFAFIETGTRFEKDGKLYRLPGKRLQSVMACKSGLAHRGRCFPWRLTDPMGFVLPPEALYRRQYAAPCRRCASKLICNGCAGCRRCTQLDE